jgi:hypothetical protein
MSWPPIDSADAAELREAESEAVGPSGSDHHDPLCTSGWLGEDLDGRLTPCLSCRPHLIKSARRTHRASVAGIPDRAGAVMAAPAFTSTTRQTTRAADRGRLDRADAHAPPAHRDRSRTDNTPGSHPPTAPITEETTDMIRHQLGCTDERTEQHRARSGSLLLRCATCRRTGVQSDPAHPTMPPSRYRCREHLSRPVDAYGRGCPDCLAEREAR